MTTFSPTPLSSAASLVIGTWAFLMVLTGMSWWFGSDHGLGMGVDGVNAAVLLVSGLKIFAVGHVFMEHRHATAWLRWSFGAWCIVTLGIVLTIYLAA